MNNHKTVVLKNHTPRPFFGEVMWELLAVSSCHIKILQTGNFYTPWEKQATVLLTDL